MNSKLDINKFYVSPYDKFMLKFDEKHEKSESQLKEIKKYQRISKLRDHAENEKGQDQLWEGF